MNRKTLFTLAVMLLCVNMAFAQGVSIGIKGGSLGFGLEGQVGFSKHFGSRLGVNYFPYKYSGEGDDIEYDYELKLMNISALLDFHPFGGGFRISGGILFNSNEITADAIPSVSYEIGDETYTVTDVGNLTGKIDFEKIAPYFSLGWGTSYKKESGLGFLIEIGAAMQGSPNVEFTADGVIADDPTFMDELAKEQENLSDDLKSYKIFPVVVIGLNYKL